MIDVFFIIIGKSNMEYDREAKYYTTFWKF